MPQMIGHVSHRRATLAQGMCYPINQSVRGDPDSAGGTAMLGTASSAEADPTGRRETVQMPWAGVPQTLCVKAIAAASYDDIITFQAIVPFYADPNYAYGSRASGLYGSLLTHIQKRSPNCEFQSPPCPGKQQPSGWGATAGATLPSKRPRVGCARCHCAGTHSNSHTLRKGTHRFLPSF